MIKLEHVDKNFGDLHVLKDVNLEVAEGEKLVIIGPSGSGKSTTVRCMSVLEEPPMDRVPIQTYVMEYYEETVREAIRRELRRGGQVYYVYNRVIDIAEVALRFS